jgi:hypothetical protein
MLSQLFFANFHFGINVFAAFVFFITGWLYLDSWKIDKKSKSNLIRSAGFFLLAASTITHASSLTMPTVTFSMQIVKIVSLSLIVGSLTIDPILHAPAKRASMFIPFVLLTDSLLPLSAVLFFLVALFYFRRSSEGREQQSMPVAFAFFFLSLAEFVNISLANSDTTIVFWSKLLAEYGVLWNISHILELAGIIILGLWVWKYLRFKTDLQLFITLVSSSLLIFVVMTATFTFLLLKNLETDTLGQLKTDMGVMQYALERLKSEALADAQAVTKNSDVQNAFLRGEDKKLFELTSGFMFAQKTNFLAVATSSGEVIIRAEDPEKTGDSLLEDSIFKSAVSGTPLVTVEIKEGAITPNIEILAADSFTDNTGVVITGFSVDNAFVDGVKISTGLDTSVYSKDVRVATTFIAPDGKSRFVGTKETNDKILSTVLENGEVYAGPTKILNQPFYTAYAPIKNAEGESIGMLFVGKPQKELFDTAQRSIQLTFTISAFLVLLSIAPLYYVSRYIKENINA